MLLSAVGLSGLESLWPALHAGEPAEAGFYSEWFMECLTSRSTFMVLPVLCAFPYASGFQEDTGSGFILMLLSRCTRMNYVCAKGAAVAFSGAAASFSALCLARVLVRLFLEPLEKSTASYMQSLWPVLGLFSLFGALWAILGAAVSILTRSRTMAYAAPFIGFYLLVILQERYVTGIAWIHPGSWLFPSPEFPWGQAGASALMAEQILIWWLIFVAAGRERLEQL